MTKRWIPICTILALLVFHVMGCSPSKTKRSQGDYQTVAADNIKQTQEARQLNAQALQAIELEDWTEAQRLLKQALEADVKFGPAHNNLGRVYFAKREFYLAAWEFEYTAKLMPHHAQPLNNLGLIHETIGRYDEAITAYTQALEKQPDSAEVLGNLVRCRIRMGYKDEQTLELLDHLILIESREDWQHWARQQRLLISPTVSDVKKSTVHE